MNNRIFISRSARLARWASLAIVLFACTARGPLAPVPEGSPESEVVSIYEASNRSYGMYDVPVPGRVPENSYARVDLRVPTVHVPGNVRLPGKIVNPSQDFLVSGSEEFDTETAFVAGLRHDLAERPANEREVIVFVHGYNMSAAQSLVRMAQLQHDLDLPGIPAIFSWPSAGSVLGYAYDRDSTLFSRDAYESYLRAIARSQPRRMILVAHSMGALLTMETLRQIALSDPGWIDRNVGGVVLISPDIAVDVFRSQVTRIPTLPQPFAIFVNKNDRALALAARVSGDEVRLGSVTNPAELADLNIVLMDVSLFSEGIGHFDFGRSPALLSLVSQIAQVELSFDEDPSGRAGLFAGTLLTVQNATRIILTPISE